MESQNDITLIIKAANQSVPDEKLQCDGEWRVSQLKSHLANVHPSKPRVEEQRLIYSGQLLADDLILRNVLRHPTENNSYTIHLVCSPPRNSTSNSSPKGNSTTTNAQGLSSQSVYRSESSGSNPSTSAPSQSSATTSSTDGIRHRNTNGNAEDTSDRTSPNNITGIAPGHPAGYEAYAGYSWYQLGQAQQSIDPSTLQAISADPVQQVANMQQIYANYMAYMQYMQMGGGLAGMAWPQHLFPNIPTVPNPPATTTLTNASSNIDQSGQQQQQQPVAEENVPVNQQQQQPPVDMVNAQVFEVEDNDENNDWLYWGFMLVNMTILMLAVYTYSTFLRFMSIMCIAMPIYMYQAGWFRPTRRLLNQEQANGNEAQDNHNNNNDGNDNNINNVPRDNAVPQEEQPQAPVVQQQEPEQNQDDIRDRGQTEREEGEADEAEADVVIRPSLLALSWTFLTTLFTSLLPERPQVI